MTQKSLKTSKKSRTKKSSLSAQTLALSRILETLDAFEAQGGTQDMAQVQSEVQGVEQAQAQDQGTQAIQSLAQQMAQAQFQTPPQTPRQTQGPAPIQTPIQTQGPAPIQTPPQTQEQALQDEVAQLPCVVEKAFSDEEEYLLIKEWKERLRQSEKVYAPYYELVKKTRSAYKSSALRREGGLSYLKQGAFNIFWAGVETQKPFLYFRRPKPYLARANKVASKAEQLACKILERALEWDLNRFDFDSVVKYARNDYLISGCGILWETYCPEFQEVTLSTGEKITLKVNESVVSRYVDPTLFLLDTNHVGIFEEASFVARKLYMDQNELAQTFGESATSFIRDHLSRLDETILVYEIWDKTTKRVYWLAPDYPAHFLKVLTDPLHLTGFFPCPKPIFSSLTNDSLLPIPDYLMIEKMLDELNGIIERMRLTMQALKVSGVYDNSFQRLESIFNKEITLVGIHDFERLKEAGGIRGVIDFIPIEQYVNTLQALAVQRDNVVQRIYEITGISDIMRGSSNANDTATAVMKKTNFGTLRNQDRQNDMQRFICDAYRLKAEMICALFDKQKLLSFLSPMEKSDEALVDEAINILKNDKMLGMILHVETECVFDIQSQTQQVLQAVQSISDMILKGINAVSIQPLLLPLYRQMVSAIASQMPQARTFESVLDQVFTSIEKELAKSSSMDMEQSLFATTLSQNARAESMARFQNNLACQKALWDYEIEKEKNRLKSRELDIKSFETSLKATQKERENLLITDKNASSNIIQEG